MRQLTTLASEAEARTLADHLLTVGIATWLSPEDSSWALWVRDEDRLPQAQTELQLYQSEPNHPRYSQAAASAVQVRAEEKAKEREYQKRVIDARLLWSRPLPQSCLVTMALVAISVVVTIGTQFGNRESTVRQWLSFASYEIAGGWVSYSPDPLDALKTGEPWRLVTPIFLHFNFLHIIFNMLFLYDVGGRIEMFRGRWRFVLLVLVTAVLSNLAQCLVSGPFFGGMSGVDYALFGYAWMKTRFDPTPGLFLPRETILIMLIWLVVCMTGLVGPIGNTAHFVGLGVGVVAGGAWPAMRLAWRRCKAR